MTIFSPRNTLKISPTNLDKYLDVQVMDKLYTIIEVAAKLGLSDKTLRRWEEAGRFTPSRTLGNQRRYSIEDLQILDAIKHGTISSQADLLTIAQAGGLCGVSSATILRWENEGKIHPFITSGNTYYPRAKLVEKLDELKKTSPEPQSELDLNTPGVERPHTPGVSEVELPLASSGTPNPKHSLVTPPLTQSSIPYTPYFIHAAITLILILSYHFFFNTPSTPVSPQANVTPNSGSVQGIQAPDPKLDLLEEKLTDHLTQEMLKDAKPLPVTTINLDNTSLYSGTAVLPKGKDQVSVTHDKLTSTSTITATFTSDFAPAKKYWVTTTAGSFTLHTDFPLGSDASFHYSFLTPTSTPAASATPSATIR